MIIPLYIQGEETLRTNKQIKNKYDQDTYYAKANPKIKSAHYTF